MFNTSSAIYGLKYQSRCVEAVGARQDAHCFLVGTLHPREENELHLIEFDEDENEIKCLHAYRIKEQVWSLCSSPVDASMFFATTHTGSAFKVSLMKLPSSAASGGNDDAYDGDGGCGDAYETSSNFNFNDSKDGYGGDGSESSSQDTSDHNGNKSVEHRGHKSKDDSYSNGNGNGNGNGNSNGDGDGNEDGNDSLTHVLELPGHTGMIHGVRWNPNDSNSVISLDSERVRVWDIQAVRGNAALGADKGCDTTAPVPGLSAGCWDPHHINQFVSTNASDVRVWDLKTMKEGTIIPHAHEAAIRDVDYNPNKPYHIITGGDDRRVKIWDLRHVRAPLSELGGHSHWVMQAKFNRFHDQLILSAGTDSSVNLWSIVSSSSAPVGDLEMVAGGYNDAGSSSGAQGGGGAGGVVEDKLIKTYDEHEDSVYSVTWSCSDAWIFASLSYDGRVVINHVPNNEKYKILL